MAKPIKQGASALGFPDPEVDAIELARLLEMTRPTQEEWDLILDAVKRYGLSKPSCFDILGNSRAGIYSILNLLAQGRG